jgi:two-component system, LytTR family, sensor kinase
MREVRSLRTWAASLLAWTAIAVVGASLRYAYYFERQPIPWLDSLAYSLTDAYLWALLTPPLIAFGVAFRLDHDAWPRLPLHLAVAIAFPLLYWFPSLAITHRLGRAMGHGAWTWELTRHEFVAAYLANLLVSIEVLAVSQWLVLHRESRERATKAARLETELARAQLQLLRLQLEPHFLFNTLHAIGTLVHADPDAAERMIVLLSDLLRRALRDMGSQEVALREEVEFLDRYLEIEHVRFPDRLRVVREIHPESLGALVPTLLLHPLVENAIRHGVARRAQGGRLGIRARRVDERLELRVWDDGPPDGGGEAPSSGIGLANTRARLEHLYGPAHRFELRRAREGGMEVAVSLPFRTSLSAGS